MNCQDFQKIIKKKKMPDTPGVYLFKQNKAILYLGKATSLRDRVRSYFSNDLIKARGMLLVDMVSRANKIDFIPTNSVLEALILETEMIKKHQPVFNTKEKDDKSFNYVVITDEKFPRVLIERGRDLENNPDNLGKKYLYKFGPYPFGAQLKEALKLVRKIFPFRDNCKLEQARPCFNYAIGLCPGTCAGLVSTTDYRKTIRHISLFFKGKTKSLVTLLKKEMNEYSKKLEFEKASEINKIIHSLAHIRDISIMKRGSIDTTSNDLTMNNTTRTMRIEAYDIAHLSGQEMVGVMVVMNNGEFDKNEYRKFNIKSLDQANDTAALREILSRRFNHPDWQLPDLVVIDGGRQQLNVADQVVPSGVTVVSVVKDNRHKAREILFSQKTESLHQFENQFKNLKNLRHDIVKINAESHRFAIGFHRKKMRGKLRNDF